MAMRKTIAIIGVDDQGKIGCSIARALAKSRYRLLLMAEEYDTALSLKKELQSTRSDAELVAMDCAKEACWEADIIILTTSHEAQREVAEKISKVSIGKIVISASATDTSGYREIFVAPDRSAAEDLQKLLPYSKIVKAFNLRQPVQGTDDERSELLIAGNSGDAVEAVAEMATTAGYHPTVVGDLTASRTLEAMQVSTTGLAIRNKAAWLSGWKSFKAAQRND
jgi:predicted dinucleotide-binding enzyme